MPGAQRRWPASWVACMMPAALAVAQANQQHGKVSCQKSVGGAMAMQWQPMALPALRHERVAQLMVLPAVPYRHASQQHSP